MEDNAATAAPEVASQPSEAPTPPPVRFDPKEAVCRLFEIALFPELQPHATREEAERLIAALRAQV